MSDPTKKKRRAGIVNRRRFLTTAGAIGLAGCTGKDQPEGSGKSEKATISLITDSSSSESKNILRGAFDDWAKTVDADVKREFQFASFSDARRKFTRQMSVGDPIDIGFLPMSVAARVNSKLTDLSEINNSLGTSDNLKIKNSKGNSVFVPHDIGMAYKWVRKDIYENAGFEIPTSPSEMWSWEEYLDIQQTLEDHLSGRDMSPDMVMANGSLWVTSWSYDPDLYSIGADIVERTGDKMETMDNVNVILDEEPNRSRAIKALKFRKKIYQNWSPKSVNYEWSDLINVFMNGNTAGTHYGGRLIVNIHNQKPELEDKVVPLPHAVNERTKQGKEDYKINMLSNGFMIPKGTEHGDLVKDFVNYYLTSEKYVDSLLAVPLHRIPPNLEILDKQKYQSNPIVKNNPEVVEFIKTFLEYGQFPINRTDPPLLPYMDWAESGENLVIPRMMAKTYAGQINPGKAVDRAAKTLRDTKSRYND